MTRVQTIRNSVKTIVDNWGTGQVIDDDMFQDASQNQRRWHVINRLFRYANPRTGLTSETSRIVDDLSRKVDA